MAAVPVDEIEEFRASGGLCSCVYRRIRVLTRHRILVTTQKLRRLLGQAIDAREPPRADL